MFELIEKWTKCCEDIRKVQELIAIEQLLNLLQMDARIWINERKPKRVVVAEKLAEDCVEREEITN